MKSGNLNSLKKVSSILDSQFTLISHQNLTQSVNRIRWKKANGKGFQTWKKQIKSSLLSKNLTMKIHSLFIMDIRIKKVNLMEKESFWKTKKNKNNQFYKLYGWTMATLLETLFLLICMVKSFIMIYIGKWTGEVIFQNSREIMKP